MEMFERRFSYRKDPGSGFAFPCDEKGHVDLMSLPIDALDNYRKCVDGEYNVVDEGVRQYKKAPEPQAEGHCLCGEAVALDRFTCPCQGCGREYSWWMELVRA